MAADPPTLPAKAQAAPVSPVPPELAAAKSPASPVVARSVRGGASPSATAPAAAEAAAAPPTSASPAFGRAASFMDKVGRTFRGKQKSKLFGVSLARLWEQRAAVPQMVLDCCAEIEARGGTAEGVFRIPGSGDAIKHYKVGSCWRETKQR